MAKFEWCGDHIKAQVPKKPKKITGTRLGAILGANRWSTPFETWCAITKVYEEPFVDSIYTIAGKTIEPKQAEYVRKCYFVPELVKPSDKYGEDYFQKTFGDFFPDDKIFGGMWDYLGEDVVYEMKTTKRVEDWEKDIPEYYALQASLYAYLLGFDKVCMVCSFLEDSDYEHPENFVPNSSNTILRSFLVSERYPNFEEDYIEEAERWWRRHVLTGVSPSFDEKKDAKILKELRKMNVDFDAENKDDILAELEDLKAEIDKIKESYAEKEARYKTILDSIKNDFMKSFREGVNEVCTEGSKYCLSLSRKEGTEVDIDRMKDDGIWDKYQKPKTTYTMRVKEKK